MQQMEELISDEAADAAATSSEKQYAPASTDLFADEVTLSLSISCD